MTFDGEFYSVEDFRLEPALGRPPRILAGGGGVETDDGRRVLESVKERLLHADGWIAAPRSPDTLEADWKGFADYLESRGRDPDGIDKVALQYLHLVPGDDRDQARRAQRRSYGGMVGSERTVDGATENWLTGTVAEVRSTLEEYERQGFDELVLHPTARTPAELDRQLRLYRRFLLSEYP